MSYVRRWYALVLALLLLLAGCAAPVQMAADEETTPAPPSPAIDEATDRLRSTLYDAPIPADFEEAARRGTRTLTGRPGSDYWTNTAQYDLEARLHPDERRLEGHARITYYNNSPDTLGTLHLELAQNLHREGSVRNEPAEITGGMNMQQVAVNGQSLEADRNARPTYVVGGTQLVLAPSEPVLPGTSTEIEVEWDFTIPQGGAGGRMGYSSEDGRTNLFHLAYWYPIMSVYDDVVGWHTDPFQGRAEFYAEFGDYDVTIEAPAEWIVWSTGTLQNAEEVLQPGVAQRLRRARESDEPMIILEPDDRGTPDDQDSLRWHFQADEVRDVAFSATRDYYWEAARTPVGDRDGDGAEDQAHIHTFWRDSAPLWEEVTRYQQHALTFHSEYTEFPYPWPHMTAIEGGGIIGGGMEYPMMTLMGSYNAAGDSALYWVTAHELAHMWVPMVVSTNERRFSWIDEGFTTFLENQARQDFFPNPPLQENPDVIDQQSYLEVARAEREGPIMRRSDYHYPGVAFGTASYSKPASILVALRGLLGEETFLDAYRSFIDSWAYKHPYPQDFFNTFERVSGRDLDWFWRSFYYETWTLDQALAKVEELEDIVRITVENQGRAPMPADLTLTFSDGETMTRRIPVNVWLEGRQQATVEIPTEQPLEQVEIDAEYAFPDIDRSDNVWAHDGAPAGSGR